jgi:hypothetical protein
LSHNKRHHAIERDSGEGVSTAMAAEGTSKSPATYFGDAREPDKAGFAVDAGSLPADPFSKRGDA